MWCLFRGIMQGTNPEVYGIALFAFQFCVARVGPGMRLFVERLSACNGYTSWGICQHSLVYLSLSLSLSLSHTHTHFSIVFPSLPLFVYVSVYVHLSVCLHACVHLSVCVHVSVCVYVCVCVCVCLGTRLWVCRCVYLQAVVAIFINLTPRRGEVIVIVACVSE